ncbi:MAG: hypothetical protein WA240_12755 [Nitrospirota bacterium]
MSDYQKEREITSKWLLKIYPVILLVFFSFIIISCAKRPPEEPPRPPKFSFEPPSVETKKLDIVLGIVAPSYDTKVLELPVVVREEDRLRMKNVIDLFSRSMASDFERMVIARGFKTKGPFKSLDYMTYPDKTGSDLTLTPKIFITPTYGTRRAGGEKMGSNLHCSQEVIVEEKMGAVMDTAWSSLHPDEVKRLKQESQKIRERKRY